MALSPEPGLRIPNMFEAALAGSFMGLYCEGEDIVQSDPNTQHVTAALSAMECVVVQDIFLNETAKYAHVFLPGASFLEKDGTFTNAERRISRVRKVIAPLAGHADWEVTQLLANALGYAMHYTHPSEIMAEIAALTPSFAGVNYDKIDRLGSVQWPCNDSTEEAGTSIMHRDRFVRGKGRFIITQYVATDEKVTQRFPLLLTTGRILSQYNVGAQTRRTHNSHWHSEDRLEIHPHDAEDRGIRDGDWVGIASRAGETVLRATVTERIQPGVVYTTFHFPESGANVITTDSSDWATNCPEYKVTAVQVLPSLSTPSRPTGSAALRACMKSRSACCMPRRQAAWPWREASDGQREPGPHGQPHRRVLRGHARARRGPAGHRRTHPQILGAPHARRTGPRAGQSRQGAGAQAHRARGAGAASADLAVGGAGLAKLLLPGHLRASSTKPAAAGDSRSMLRTARPVTRRWRGERLR